MSIELLARAVVYALAILAVVAAAFWWGWDQRTKLALKIEHFGITNKRWVAYDDYLRKEGRPPTRADIHAIEERQSGR